MYPLLALHCDVTSWFLESCDIYILHGISFRGLYLITQTCGLRDYMTLNLKFIPCNIIAQCTQTQKLFPKQRYSLMHSTAFKFYSTKKGFKLFSAVLFHLFKYDCWGKNTKQSSYLLTISYELNSFIALVFIVGIFI